jgi:hypothetical protein
MGKRILIVGHCNMDGPRLLKEISAKFPGCDVKRVNGEDRLRVECERGADLLLINREPVGFAEKTGLDLVRETREQFPGCRVMLVSDYPDAQQEAERAGAVPGFGKSQMGTEALVGRVREALGAEA